MYHEENEDCDFLLDERFIIKKIANNIMNMIRKNNSFIEIIKVLYRFLRPIRGKNNVINKQQRGG